MTARSNLLVRNELLFMRLMEQYEALLSVAGAAIDVVDAGRSELEDGAVIHRLAGAIDEWQKLARRGIDGLS